MILTPDQFLAFVLQWAQQNAPGIRRVWSLIGDWEAWAQAEIAAHILQIDVSTSILREAEVYSNLRRASFLLNFGATHQPQELVVVEMRCETLTNSSAFIAGINKGFAGLQNGLIAPFTFCQKLALGIFFSREAGEQLQRQGYKVTFTDSGIGVAARQC